MKKLLTITLLSAAMAVSGQSVHYKKGKAYVLHYAGRLSNDTTWVGFADKSNIKKYKTDTTKTGLINFIGTSNYITSNNFAITESTIPSATITFMRGGSKPIVTISLKKDGKTIGLSPDWDVMEIRMSKKNFYWLNDSTAILINK
jgi:hypothetical protein